MVRPLRPGEFSLVQMNVAGFFQKKLLQSNFQKKIKNKTVISKQYSPCSLFIIILVEIFFFIHYGFFLKYGP